MYFWIAIFRAVLLELMDRTVPKMDRSGHGRSYDRCARIGCSLAARTRVAAAAADGESDSILRGRVLFLRI
jgi:hypothetical protein